MYTDLLKEILKNEINLNIIIDKNNKLGLVYQNDIDKYIQMKSSDIIDKTMVKLKKHLLDINSESKCITECLEFSKKYIDKKHDNYENISKIKEIVNDHITQIYDSIKDNAIEISKKNKKSDYNLEAGY